ncbi:MAG: hypothetical protein N2512_10140 [Armatimonadetes bacterium]|nr:hypothetical protein [Armatimonadota bacterium]
MTARIVVVEGLSDDVGRELAQQANLCLDWRSPSRNVNFDTRPLWQQTGPPSPEVADLLDLAAAVYLADLAVLRGRNERFVRDLELHVPVRRLDLWRSLADDLVRLVWHLTGDNLSLHLWPRPPGERPPKVAGPSNPPGRDCVCLLSGGLDSLAGAVMLLRTGRRPFFVSHRSGNPTVLRTQKQVVTALRRLQPDLSHIFVVLAPRVAASALPFPPPDQREPSRRSRSLLFMTLGVAAAAALGVTEVYLPENGVLTVALPLTPSRIGGLSTRSTHPTVINLFNHICRTAGLNTYVLNPFVYRTKTELIADLLRPVLRPEEILGTVSCWMTGRRHRQCGGCIPCLLRRVSLLAAGLPDEAYEIDLLARPEEFRGTDAFSNLVDFLSYVAQLNARSEAELILHSPALLDLQAEGVSLPDVVAMLKRFAAEVTQVVRSRFPAAVRLLENLSSGETF